MRPTLARRYARTVAGLSVALLLVSGVSEMLFSYRESREHIARLQTSRAEAAAREIQQYLHGIEQGLLDALKLPLDDRPGSLERLREEFHRLMVIQPAIADVLDRDGSGRVRLFVSRSDIDRVGAAGPFASPGSGLAMPTGAAASAAGRQWSATFDRDAFEPWALLTVSNGGGGHTEASVNLRFLADVVSGLRSADGGETYVVDAGNRLIAHPRPSQVLRRLDLSALEPVRRARQTQPSGAASGGLAVTALDADDLDGSPVIATAARIPPTDWLVFVMQPRSRALEPALATLARTLLLVVVAGVLALLASVLFARRMAAPIVALRQATGRIAAGDLASPIEVPGSGDEIEDLAEDFNRMALELRASYAGLEAKVADRTVALSEARDRLQAQAAELAVLNRRLTDQMVELGISKEHAEQASAAKTRFLAAASHDLRQPMHSIGLLVGLLGEQLPPGDGRDLSNKVRESVAVMEGLFASLLDISKLDAGAVQPRPEDLAIAAVLAQVAQAYAPQAAARGLRLRVLPSRALVRSDPAWLLRMLGNLVANAVRYTAQGTVLIGCRRRGNLLAVQVIDTGPGIAADQLSHIFEEFVRLPQPGQDDGQGLGLGLSIVRRTADLLGHSLEVRSVPGRGSCFELLLPRIADAAPSAPTGTQSLRRERLAGAFVLVIDDNDGNREATAALFRQWGAHVLAAAGTEAALTGLDGHLRAPDLLLTDHRLGSADDGFAAIARLRAAAEQDIPAIVVTADVGPEPALGAASMRARLLHKPAGADALLRAACAALAAGDGSAAN